MSNFFNRSTAWIVDRPAWAVLLLAVISGIAVYGYLYPGALSRLLEGSGGKVVGIDDEFNMAFDVGQFNLASADAVIVARSDSFFTEGGVRALRNVVDSIERLPSVKGVMWLDRLPVINLFGLPEPLLPDESASDSLMLAAREKALRHPFVRGQLLSEDGRTMLLMVWFDYLMIEDDASCTQLLQETACKAADAAEGPEIEFLLTGPVPMVLTAIASHEQNQLKYQLIGYGMIALMSIILFRGIASVLIVAIAPAIGVFWTLGFIRLFEFGQNPFIDVVLPVLISLVGLTDGVHLIVQIRRNRAAGMEPLAAARLGIAQVGLACGLTSLTTAIGFASLSLAHHELVREFGWTCVVGVVLTFVAVVTVIPLACASRLGRRIHIGHGQGLVDRNLGRISSIIEVVLRHQRLLAWIGIVFTLLLVLVSGTLRPDERRQDDLPLGSDAAVAIDLIDEAMNGLEFSSVNIRWDEGIAADDPRLLEVIREVDQHLAGEQLIGYPMSIRTLLAALPGEGREADRLSMLALLPTGLREVFFDPARRLANVSFRVRDLGIAAYGPVFERLEEKLAKLADQNHGFQLSMSGTAIWRWENLYQIVVDLAASLGTATIVILIVLSIVFRSWRIGLISIVPNLFPLAVAGTWLVLAGYSLEIVMVCAFTVCLGIAVDDTIHFLTRYLDERQRNPDHESAIRDAFTGVGTALIMTTVILVAGFLTVISSDSRDHHIFASMGAITVAAALFGDLVFLPALLARFEK